MTTSIKSKVFKIINHDLEDNLQVEYLINNVIDALKIKINSNEIPAELEFIVVEASVSRYRKIGSEGMSSESIDSHSMSFDFDVFEPFEALINEWKTNNKKRNKVRFL